MLLCNTLDNRLIVNNNHGGFDKSYLLERNLYAFICLIESVFSIVGYVSSNCYINSIQLCFSH